MEKSVFHNQSQGKGELRDLGDGEDNPHIIDRDEFF